MDVVLPGKGFGKLLSAPGAGAGTWHSRAGKGAPAPSRNSVCPSRAPLQVLLSSLTVKLWAEASVVAHPLKRGAEKVQVRCSGMNLSFEFVCFRNNEHQTTQTECVCLH